MLNVLRQIIFKTLKGTLNNNGRTFHNNTLYYLTELPCYLFGYDLVTKFVC